MDAELKTYKTYNFYLIYYFISMYFFYIVLVKYNEINYKLIINSRDKPGVILILVEN